MSRGARVSRPRALQVLAVAVGAASVLGGMHLSSLLEDRPEEVVEASPARLGGVVPAPEATAALHGTTAPPGQPRLLHSSQHNPFAALVFESASASLGTPAAPAPAAQKRRSSPPVAAAAVAAPQAPVAPPLPFRAMGAITGPDIAGGTVVFLQQGETMLVVRKGEQIGAQYKVDSVTKEGIELTYLPLGQRQVLSLTP